MPQIKVPRAPRVEDLLALPLQAVNNSPAPIYRNDYILFRGGFQQGGITNFQQGNIGDQAVLTWAGIDADNVVVSSDSDYNRLSNLKNILLMLQTEFAEGGAKVIFTGEKKDDFNKRLLLIEHEIDGLLKRKINYAARD